MATFFFIISAILFIAVLWLNGLSKEAPLFYHYPNIKMYVFFGGIIALILGLIMR